jgi:hypothetical protein
MTPTSNQATGHSAASDLTLQPAGQPLAIRFFRSGDQFMHHVTWDAGQQPRILLASMLPTCPHTDFPVQEVVRETHGGSPALLAIGRSGKNHWSAAITSAAGSASIELELACRFHEAVAAPACRYRVEDGVEITAVEASQIRLNAGRGQLTVRVGKAGQLKLDEASRQLGVCATTPAARLPQTVVWAWSLIPTIL